jgi:putative AdoMet-dependent methyltransferase
VEVDLFPASDFDGWASSYDLDVLAEAQFPFTGYQQALDTVLKLAAPQPGMRVLDIGTGTANLAALFVTLGCHLWGTDFSPAMLEQAQRKLPQAKFVLADVRHGWSPELPPIFERIVSAYVFHHFNLAEKVRLLTGLSAHIEPAGRLVIADIAFPDQAGMEQVCRLAGDEWEDEYYWLADETILAVRQAGLCATFTPVSTCAGVFVMEKQ